MCWKVSLICVGKLQRIYLAYKNAYMCLWRTLAIYLAYNNYYTCPDVTSGFKAEPNAHSMCAQGSSLHTYHTENGYRITSVTIYNIYYRIMSLRKT
jgi:hypothetical protein